MRLKSLRRPRPVFETEGAFVTGNKIDLTNDTITKYCYHRDSINNDNSRQSSNHSPKHLEQIRQTLSSCAPIQSYQTIEAAYLEHGIKIHILKTTNNVSPTMKVKKENTPSLLTPNAKPFIRYKTFSYNKQNYNPQQRSTSVLQCSKNYNDGAKIERNHMRPFSELQTTSSTMTDDFNKNHVLNVSYAVNEQQQMNPFSVHSSSLIASENSDTVEDTESTLTAIRTQLSVRKKENELKKSLNNKIRFNEEVDQLSSRSPPQQQQQVKEEDPDFIYMCNLLKKNTGETYTNTIRRQAGFRNTFAVHRRSSQNLLLDNELDNKNHYNKPLTSRNHIDIVSHPSSTIKKYYRSDYDYNQQHQMNTNQQYKSSVIFTQKKIEKDIVKHASRIRTTQSKDYYSLINSGNRLLSACTNTNTNINSISQKNVNQNQSNKHRTTTYQPPSSISLKPLQILLNTPVSTESSIINLKNTSLSKQNNELPEITVSSLNLTTYKSPVRKKKTVRRKKTSKYTPEVDLTTSSSDISSNDLLLKVSSTTTTTTSFFGDSLPLSKKESTPVADVDRQSSSLDSGYDRSDSQSIVSGLSTIQNTLSIRSSTRLTNSTLCVRSKKRVSFGDETITYP